MCNEAVLFWNESTQGYALNISVTPDKALNGFTVKNDGTNPLTVNGAIIQPLDFKAFGGNRGEIYKGRIDIAFQNPPVAGSFNLATVTQKFYVKQGNRKDPSPSIDQYLSNL